MLQTIRCLLIRPKCFRLEREWPAGILTRGFGTACQGTHNNDTERDLRHVVTGRKNWLIFKSQRGGDVAGRIFSLVMSSKLAGINVMAYLEDALSLISTTKASDIAKLTPWGWKAAQLDAAASANA